MAPSTEAIVSEFTRALSEQLDETQLGGPVRLDNTHTVVIIPLKGKDPIHAHLRCGVTDAGRKDILEQIKAVPSLKNLLKDKHE